MRKELELANNYKDLQIAYPFKIQLRSWLRNRAVFLLSLFARIDCKGEWIRFPFYHHVFDDECVDFDRQLKKFKNYGDYISLDEAVNILASKEKIGGRYFSIMFDDGFKNCLTNGLPILIDNNCLASFFIPTDYIGTEIDNKEEVFQKFFVDSQDAYPIPVQFLNWNDCRKLQNAGMTIGAHTCSHLPLISFSKQELIQELLLSKKKIEEELGVVCNHFCCPWGRVGKHFDLEKHLEIVKELGYSSFCTTERGANYQGSDPFFLKRDHFIAGWGNYQLRYFLSK